MKVSIITINRNDAVGLKKTLASVIEQTYGNIEYIVIDGASTDNSQDVIQENTSRIHFWISEPDTGIYNAMNKGVARATGDWLIFMNAGDTFVDATIVQQFVDGNHIEDIVFGNQIRVMSDGEQKLWEAPEKIDFLFFYASGIPHQSTFISKKVFKKIGNYREDFRIYSDWEHAERAVLKYRMTCKSIPITVSIYDKTGISSNPKHRLIRRKEIAECRNELFGKSIWDLAEESLKMRNELQILYDNKLVQIALKISKKLQKKLDRIQNKSKHYSVITEK
jgi:glycosyltransferase involved in cell wall biosynthesis